MYDSIPTILTPQELLDKALGRSAKIRKSDPVAFYRTRKTLEARTLALKDLVMSTLDGFVKAFPNLGRVDTYERELVDVLVGVDSLRIALGRVSGASKAVGAMCDRVRREYRKAGSEDELRTMRRRVVGRVSGLVGELEQPLSFLANARHVFGVIPEVSPGDTTIVVAGYPNVGKSSLLGALSGARPDIAPYAFTTKHVNVGHFMEPGIEPLRARRFQLVDTPGLLEKPPSQRNAIEQQAALALAYLADLVVFVIDPTESCGYTLADQERLLAHARTEFPAAPFLEIETKSDFGGTAGGRHRVSATTRDGLEELRNMIVSAAPVDTFARRLAEASLPSRPAEAPP